MIEITARQVTVELQDLFERGEPQSQRCFAVLAGHASVRTFTDHIASPTWGMVGAAGDGTLYLGGAVVASLLGQAATTLRKESDVLLGLWHNDPRWALSPPDPDPTGTTIDLGYRTEREYR